MAEKNEEKTQEERREARRQDEAARLDVSMQSSKCQDVLNGDQSTIFVQLLVHSNECQYVQGVCPIFSSSALYQRHARFAE